MAIDIFGDRDLGTHRTERIAAGRYPSGIPSLARKFPAAPAIFTGALENHPEVIARLVEDRKVWGPSPEALARVRDPFLLGRALARAGLPCPRCLPGDAVPPRDERWLVKPLRGAGGSGIELWRARSRTTVRPGGPNRTDPRAAYLQEWIPGRSGAAIFIASTRGVFFLGATWQIVGDPDFGARGFRYVGSLGPLRLPRRTREVIERVANLLAAEFGLRGIFGVDFVLHGGVPWPVEVNPRYTASIEIIELTLGVAALRGHAEAFAGSSRDVGEACSHRTGPRRRGWLGKAILFARSEVRFPERFAAAAAPSSALWPSSVHWPSSALWTVPRIADIPSAGERISPGRPILTLFARGTSAEACRTELGRAAAEVYRGIEKPTARTRSISHVSGVGR